MAYFTVRGKSEAAGAHKRALTKHGHNRNVGVTVQTVDMCGTTKDTSYSSLNTRPMEPQMNHKRRHHNQKGKIMQIQDKALTNTSLPHSKNKYKQHKELYTNIIPTDEGREANKA